MTAINESLYFYMLGNNRYLPHDWNSDSKMFWYTVGCYWLDRCGGGNNMLWYIRKTYNYVMLNPFVGTVEINNRLLQLVVVLKYYTGPGVITDVPVSVPSWTDIINQSKCHDMHLCNYNWICIIFMESGDSHRVKKIMSLALIEDNIGTMITPAVRNSAQVIRELLVQRCMIGY